MRMPMPEYQDSDGGVVRWLDTVRVYLRREREGLPHVERHRDENARVRMSRAEARERRDNLTKILAIAEG
jgi:hypothetical protein